MEKFINPSGAAFVNGALGHSLDFDDTHAEASLHSSAPILSAALSAAQMKNCSGQQLITACVIGYEIQIRLGLAGGASKHYNRGFHPTATCGIFGAVAATGHILGLNKDHFIIFRFSEGNIWRQYEKKSILNVKGIQYFGLVYPNFTGTKKIHGSLDTNFVSARGYCSIISDSFLLCFGQ